MSPELLVEELLTTLVVTEEEELEVELDELELDPLDVDEELVLELEELVDVVVFVEVPSVEYFRVMLVTLTSRYFSVALEWGESVR